ncbi:carboxypeptidase-like regulatory domain-containing protein, partial [Thermodesulfobacteriota bacterium]
MKKLLGKLALCFLLLICSWNNAKGDQLTNPCVLLGALTTPAQDTQFFTVDLKGGITSLLGDALHDTDVAGVAVHPVTGILYALIASHQRSKEFILVTVDRSTGAVSQTGSTGLKKVGGLAIRPTDGTLWTWIRGVGPAIIDTATGAAQVMGNSNAVVTDIAWQPNGTFLMAAGGRVLWKWNPADDSLTKRSKLPLVAQAMTMRADGRLLFPAPRPDSGLSLDDPPGHDRGFILQTVDPGTGLIDATLSVPPIPIDTVPEISAAVVESLTWPISCGNPSPGGPADLITEVSVDPSTICPGESVHIKVETNHPEGGTNPVDVTVGGLPGASMWLQFIGEAGSRPVSILASTAEGYYDSENISVEVDSCEPPDVPLPVLRIRQDPYRADLVDLEVQNADIAAPPGSEFFWEFGDGTTAEGTVPFVRHSYSAAIPKNLEFVIFDAAVTVQLPDDSLQRTEKTVSIWNQYAADKKRGLIRPLINPGAIPATASQNLPSPRSITPASETYTITNIEDSPITITGRQTEYQYCDPDHAPVFSSWESLDILLAPGESVTQSVNLPTDEEICGVGVHLMGEADILHKVATDIYFQTRRNEYMAYRVSDAATLAALNAAASLGGDADRVSEENLFQLSRELRIPHPEGGAFVAPPTFEPDPYIGTECQPGDAPHYEGISCQATEEWSTAPPHIHNALKGDVLISTECGFVGDLLRAVNPPQFYSHSGIMTSNYYDLAHSTASSDRYTDYPQGGGDLTDGIQEDVLKYGWPGVIQQTVQQAFSSQDLTDPNGNSFELQGFSQNPVQCPSDTVITYPQVVRPPAGLAESVRPMLGEAAEIAKNTQHGNYRLYAYTDTAVVTVNDNNYWHDGPATMCSGFVWRSLRAAGVLFEGPALEPGDVLDGAEPPVNDWDGLYGYTEEERLDAGNFIYNSIYDQVYAQAGWFGNALTDAADDLANQFANCFASDWCAPEAKDSDQWSDPGLGQAVSPQNILFWDSPETGGAFGYHEPMAYRNGDNVRVYRWARSPGAGDLRGIVTREAVAVENATVILEVPIPDNPGLFRETSSEEDGTFSFLGVPAGQYTIRAQKPDDYLGNPVILEGTETAVVPFEAEGYVALELGLPVAFRRLTFQGDYKIVDHENVGDNEVDEGSFFTACNVDPYLRTDSFEWISPCVGDEVVAKYVGECKLLDDDRTVQWSGQIKLYEQTDCDPTDLDGVYAWFDFVTAEDQTEHYVGTAHNDDPYEPSWDWA